MSRTIHQVLAELELISHGQTQAWNASGGHDAEGRVSPPGELDPPHLRFRRKWLEATVEQRPGVLEAAELELRSIKHRHGQAPAMSDREVLERRILEAKGWTAGEVAQSLRTTVSTVRRVRVANGLDAADGTAQTLSGAADGARAREMRERGMSERQIALILGAAKSTARRLAA
jgi:hypothetical protein